MKEKLSSMVEERVKFEFEIEEKNKTIRELNHKINTLKKDNENIESICSKRDSQVSSLLNRIKTLEGENQKLTNDLSRKQKNLLLLQGEVTELRPSKEAMTMLERQTRIIEELKKQLQEKNNENSMLKSLINSWQHTYLGKIEHSKSPKKFPLISQRSGAISISKSVDSSKSFRNNDLQKIEDFEIDKSHILDQIEESEAERLKIDAEKVKLVEKRKEEERIKKEQDREEKEGKMMEIEEETSFTLRELLKKEEEEKQGKGKTGKVAAKTGVRKK
jgi:hypothetical protein